jgi:hypothetical protein
MLAPSHKSGPLNISRLGAAPIEYCRVTSIGYLELSSCSVLIQNVHIRKISELDNTLMRIGEADEKFAKIVVSRKCW